MTSRLIEAAELGDLDTVRVLLAAGADVNQTDVRGRTAAMAATHANQPEIVRALIEAGADLSIQDNIQDNPFLYAGAEGRLEILRLCIAAGPDYSKVNRYGGSALIPACHHGHEECVRELLTTSKVDIDHVNRLGWTALLETVILSDGGPVHQRILQMLVDQGANLDLADFEGVTALEHAKQRGFDQMVRILAN